MASLANQEAVCAFTQRPPITQTACQIHYHSPKSSTSFLASSSSSVANPVSETQTTIQPPKIRRKYQAFLWSHEDCEYTINYRVEGPKDGAPILLVHGFGANVGHYRHQFPALVKEGYRVYAVDLLGFGASDKPGGVEYSIELFVTLLTDFTTKMHDSDNKKKWIVAGNSIGGLCSLGVAEQLPDLVQGVVLFNCAGGMTGFRYGDVPMIVRPLLYFLQKVVLGPQLGGQFFSNFRTRENVESILRTQGVYGDQINVNDELLEILLEPADDEGAEAVFLKTFAGPPGPTPESILPNLSCPILAIWGGADPWTPVDSGMHPGTEFEQFSNDFELVVLPGVGHCPHDEAPDQVHTHMIPWMKALDSKSN